VHAATGRGRLPAARHLAQSRAQRARLDGLVQVLTGTGTVYAHEYAVCGDVATSSNTGFGKPERSCISKHASSMTARRWRFQEEWLPQVGDGDRTAAVHESGGCSAGGLTTPAFGSEPMETTQSGGSEILYTCMERDEMVWAEIVLNRPEKGNALNLQMIRQLADIAAKIEADGDIRAAVIRGRGRFFCTGGDIEAWGALTPLEMARDWVLRVFRHSSALRAASASDRGSFGTRPRRGTGTLVADLRIAVQSAKLGTPKVTLGMISGWMGVRRLAEVVGVARARQLTLLGLPITAAQALDWGLVNAVAADDDELERQLAVWLARLCSNGPAAMGLIKRNSGVDAHRPPTAACERRSRGGGH